MLIRQGRRIPQSRGEFRQKYEDGGGKLRPGAEGADAPCNTLRNVDFEIHRMKQTDSR